MFAQHRQDVILIPALVTKLERIPIPRRQHSQEAIEPLTILQKMRWQLKEHRNRLWSERPEAGVHQLDGVLAFGRQSLPMSNELGSLPGTREISTRLILPS